MNGTVLIGDCREMLRALPDGCVHTCVTSPPYFGLRDYGVDGQIGLEQTPDAFVAEMVAVFREVRRVLRDDGTLWVNLGDSYNAGTTKPSGPSKTADVGGWTTRSGDAAGARRTHAPALKVKDLIGVPWRVAFALQADGWYLRQDIIWAKPNPMPESVTDRCTKAHEYLFLLSKSPRYYYDHEAIKNPPSEALLQQVRQGYEGADTKDYSASMAQSASGTKARIIERAREKIDKQRGHDRRHAGFVARWDHLTKDEQASLGSNKRSVWSVATKPFREAHFATYPPDLIEPCILAGAPEGGVVLDPFFGAGTTGLVAQRRGRRFIGVELNPAYAEIAERRIRAETPRPSARDLLLMALTA
jgi:DNA modification methylase